MRLSFGHLRCVQIVWLLLLPFPALSVVTVSFDDHVPFSIEIKRNYSSKLIAISKAEWFKRKK